MIGLVVRVDGFKGVGMLMPKCDRRGELIEWGGCILLAELIWAHGFVFSIDMKDEPLSYIPLQITK